MVGQARLLIVPAFFAASIYAQSPAPSGAPGSTSATPHPHRAGPRKGPPSPEFDDVRKALSALTPQQRQRFAENFRRWATLPPQEREALADRETLRRQKRLEEIETAMKKADLQLRGERRTQFARRYTEERRKLEETLRQEMEARRGPALDEIIARLKKDFSENPGTGSGQ